MKTNTPFFAALLIFSLQAKMTFADESSNPISMDKLLSVPILEKIDMEKEMSQIKKLQQKQQLLQKEWLLKPSESSRNNLISLLEKQQESYLHVAYYFSYKNNDAQAFLDIRQPVTFHWLVFYKRMNDLVDKDFNFNNRPFLNISPGSDHDICLSGVSPENIKDPEIRKDYVERLAKNARYALEYGLQHKLKRLISQSLDEINEFVIKSYSQSPHDDDELIGLLDKYKYPEEEKVKIFKALNIPYKGFREWQTNDNLFKPTAKFIFYNAKIKEATLEREDGKRMSIEWSALRKEDQEYIRRQIELDQKKLKE